MYGGGKEERERGREVSGKCREGEEVEREQGKEK